MGHEQSEFISMRDFVVRILLKLGLYKWLVERINRIKFVRQAKQMRRNGLAMLAVADKALSDMGIRPFLTYGALLGAYREHGFISYDPDIDLGILEEEMPVDLDARMAEYGFNFHRRIRVAESGRIGEITYEYKGLHLDVFVYYREGDELFSYIQRNHETKEWKEANATDGFPNDRSYVPACEFERRDFLGLQIFMPVNTDGWLRAIYSDSYMTPIRNWNAADGYVTRITHTAERSYREFI